MQYLADPRRADPRLLLPGCSSILVLAIRYGAPEKEPGASPLHGRVAAYARGRDYHLLLPGRLQALAEFIGVQAGRPIPSRSYTDTGPLMERDLAQRAGLGWIGKNTCLIHSKIGSYFFLAEILLGIEIEPDAPFTADRCGTCTRCLEACPSGALLQDRSMDARRCISYLTIENKGSIPPELRLKLGNRVFGCDVCQTVCPWNQRIPPGADPAFTTRPGTPTPDLCEELSLTRQEFDARFKDSPVLRARRKGYLRNIAVALGNSGDPIAMPALKKALEDDEALIREHAAWALEQIRS